MLLAPACSDEPAAEIQDVKTRAPETSEPKAGREPTKFLRWVPAGETEGRFETAVVTYEDAKGHVVDLVSAVHIADRAYYDQLQRMFAGYDALLYEFVAPKGVRPDPDAGRDSFVSVLQRGLKSFLDLDFQLDAIDYSAKNFVHADLDPATFFEKQRKKGESLVTLMLRAMLVGLKRQREGKGSKLTPIHLLASFLSSDRARYMKFLFAQELENIDEMMAALWGGKTSASVIIGERNSEAMRVFDEELAAGKAKLGIFYGGGHMPDLEERLLERGFRRKQQRWITAWDCMMSDEMREAVEKRKRRRARAEKR